MFELLDSQVRSRRRTGKISREKKITAMKMSKVGNQTNSQDPQAVNSRVFVGNLNTFQCSKTDVERMFQRYGRLAGISMHKGYAFVQFTNPFDARSACLGEDGRTILSQILEKNRRCSFPTTMKSQWLSGENSFNKRRRKPSV
ncbi:PREDICTED: heterogeneous nuclear ribonucleoprotein C-like isoform X2 [Polistes canadensis]|uniref:heterogeneous nuclear ribonucleoprotein C-like isoform X2 n=1 Tax=Polistes canadensis TaxID=91411 RepID=UPI000718C52C|nr:PREDICTED: heterogeneous nuclear ribonucleoprotein C-like isoform X2 [Polistes canadensis]XP_014604983.1 PREDICTED: heterogeneous nuclear ribonucleoprotein C-like isoform X2 [Polistes canadensis]XP_014604984.1 PREDICTED: heterogeneous nuclear ribonucleoprotein C-like isoform X2 [Polistes canadensis]